VIHPVFFLKNFYTDLKYRADILLIILKNSFKKTHRKIRIKFIIH
jgi:hypothetical protein